MLIRMLSNINKWDGSKSVNRPNAFICGDAIGDLKTTDNRLSVWKADSDQDIEDALVALAMNRDKVDKICYCLLDERYLHDLNIDVAHDMKGDAPGLSDEILLKHRDLIELDYWSIGFLAEHMSTLLTESSNRHLASKAKLKALLNDYKLKNKIDLGKMKSKLKTDLKW